MEQLNFNMLLDLPGLKQLESSLHAPRGAVARIQVQVAPLDSDPGATSSPRAKNS